MATTEIVTKTHPGHPFKPDQDAEDHLTSTLVCRSHYDAEDNLASYPAKLISKLCWDSSSLRVQDYVVQLSAQDVKDIEYGVLTFKKSGLPISMICPDKFPLPESLSLTLRSLSSEVHSGRGFVVLRGLNPKTRTQEENVVAFCGVLSYVGIDRATNSNKVAMDHLRDAAKDPKPYGREHIQLHPSKMMAPLKFHADRDFADIVGLFVNSKAAVGGQQRLSSFWTVYNQMRELSPDALRILAKDFPWPGVVDGEPATTYTPVMFHHSEKVYCQLVYRIFEGTNILNEEQWWALNTLEKFADENSIELDVVEGDIQLINNFALLHGRRGWVDRSGKHRHYFRLGIRDPELAWPRPKMYEWLFDNRFGTVLEEQIIPITDYDPYGLTSMELNGHG